jgi:hypothetical protein
MPRRSNDPIKAGVRKAKTKRRVGAGAFCVDCGESHADMLVQHSRPKRCVTCHPLKVRRKKSDGHHLGAKANSPLTVEIPVKDHRTVTDAQLDWPPQTLQNPDGSPVLAIAGCLRGIADFIADIITAFIRRLATATEEIDAVLREKYGLWWKGTKLDGWQPT